MLIGTYPSTRVKVVQREAYIVEENPSMAVLLDGDILKLVQIYASEDTKRCLVMAATTCAQAKKARVEEFRMEKKREKSGANAKPVEER